MDFDASLLEFTDMLHIVENLSDSIQREAYWFGELLPASQEQNNRQQL